MYRLIFVLLLGGILTSCDNFLTRYSISDVPASSFPSSESDAQSIITGMYDAIQNALETNYFYWGDMRSDVIERNGTNGDIHLLFNTLSPSHATANWNNLYKVTLSANIVIKYIPNLEGDENNKNRMLAEAYTARAWMYFYAVRVWGRVPLILEPYENKEGQKLYYPREDLSVIYGQIESDLKEAIRLFGIQKPVSCYEFSRGMASAVLTDFYMWINDYPKAIETSEFFINKSTNSYGYAKGNDWKNIFVDPKNSDENIYVLYWDYASDNTHEIIKQIGGGKSNNAQIKISKRVWDKFIQRKNWDKRFALSLDTVNYFELYDEKSLDESAYSSFAKLETNYCAKWLTLDSEGKYPRIDGTKADYKIPMYRYTGIMLLRAEALARRNEGNDLQNAISIVNDVRNRFEGAPLLSGNETQTDVINLIEEERILELWGEGTRWFDLVRTGRAKSVMDDVFINDRDIPEGFGDEQYILWPIHQSAFSANPELVGDQNPGYVEG